MTLLWLMAIWLIGFGLMRALYPQPVRWSLHNILLFSLGIGAGAGVASCLYFLMLVLAGPNFTLFASVIGGAAVVAVSLSLLAKKRGPLLDWAEGPPVPRYLVVLFAVAAALAVTMFLGAVLFNPHGDEAAWSIWNLRARFLFRGGASWRNAFVGDLRWTRLDYPLMLPGLVALCWNLAREESQNAPIAIAFLFGLGATGLLASTLGILRGRALALVGCTLLLGTASFVALTAALYADVPLSFYILATLALLCLQDRHPQDLRFTAVAGLMAGFAAWTRNEGIIFIAALILARAIALLKYRGANALIPQLLRLLAGAAAPLAIVIFFKLRVGGPSDLLSVPPPMILHHLADPTRWIATLEGLVITSFTFGRFLIPILLAMALYWYLVRFQVETSDVPALATGVIALGLTLAVQLLLDVLFVDNLQVEISTSFERMMLQLWPAALLLFFVASGPLQLVATKTASRKAKAPPRSVKQARRERTTGAGVAETR